MNTPRTKDIYDALIRLWRTGHMMPPMDAIRCSLSPTGKLSITSKDDERGRAFRANIEGYFASLPAPVSSVPELFNECSTFAANAHVGNPLPATYEAHTISDYAQSMEHLEVFFTAREQPFWKAQLIQNKNSFS